MIQPSIQVPSRSEFDHLLFEPGIRNDIVIQFTVKKHGRILVIIFHVIELLDEDDLDSEDSRNIVGDIQFIYPYCLISISGIINVD